MAVIPDHATWVRFPRFVGDAAMQLPVLRLLKEINVGPLVVWGPTVVCGCAPNNRARETEGGEGDGEA